ncbi:hypothetical protein Pla22_31150 [Rubripirellula amarantea]|uniref:N-acetyltransferase domain-containing protein n=1 Tax=Rubripirellula amarantea TaxID=2527999 RepID=A0A5C5WK86_9BACT|nr:GNAT family N-acetyltransferase [Rubripirellula amarantea]TWT50373.1 hypothetical protein Pla22_31150 [Rubripirellula amarantea]
MLGRIQARGWWYSIGIVVNRIVPAKLFRMRIFRVFEFRCPGEASAAALNSPSSDHQESITFRWCVDESEKAEAARLTHYQPDDTASEHRACLAYDGETAIGGVWIASGSFDESELGVRIHLNDDQVWLFAAFIAKSHRRRGIYRRLLEYVLTTHSRDDLGLRPMVLASINPTNKASIAAHQVYFASEVGTAWTVRVLSWTWCRANGRLHVDQTVGNSARSPLTMTIATAERVPI